MPVVEDMAVPPEVLPDFLVRMQNVLKRHQVTASLFCHAGQGQLHLQPFLDLADPGDVRDDAAAGRRLYQEVFDVGGTISGEHGLRARAARAFVRRQYGELYDVFRAGQADLRSRRTSSTRARSSATTRDLLTRNLRPAVIASPETAGAGGRQATESSPRLRRPGRAAVELGPEPGGRRGPRSATAAASAARSRPTCGCARSFASCRPRRRRRGPRPT